MIEVSRLTKDYGRARAVDDLTFSVPAGQVTGFLGPNGAGKSTTMRLVLGLERPTSGRALVNGVPYRDLAEPMREVGALLDAGGVPPGMTAAAHLGWLARAGNLPPKRVDEVLDAVGLTEVARRRVGGFSLGMKQRLGVAAALLGDPGILVLDEPVNGLDPEGIRWMRTLMRGLAAEGRTVLVSSHLMSEMADTADRVVVIGAGRLIADTSVDELVRGAARGRVRVVSGRARELAEALTARGFGVEPVGPSDGGATGDEDAGSGDPGAEGTGFEDTALSVTGADAGQVGEVAARHGFALRELVQERAGLEDVFMELTGDSAQHTFAPSEGVLERSR